MNNKLTNILLSISVTAKITFKFFSTANQYLYRIYRHLQLSFFSSFDKIRQNKRHSRWSPYFFWRSCFWPPYLWQIPRPSMKKLTESPRPSWRKWRIIRSTSDRRAVSQTSRSTCTSEIFLPWTPTNENGRFNWPSVSRGRTKDWRTQRRWKAWTE